MVREALTRRVHPHGKARHDLFLRPVAPPGARRRGRGGDRPADRRRARAGGGPGPAPRPGTSPSWARRTPTATSTTGTTTATPSTTTASTTTSAWRSWPPWSTRSAPSGAARRRWCSTPATPSRARPLATYYAKQEPITSHRREAPDGPGHERHRLRRGDAGQPRVQLRPAAAGPVDPSARLPGARRERDERDDRQAGLPAVRHQEGLPRLRARRPCGSASSA